MSDQEHHLRTLIQTLERENADLRAKLACLDGFTNWVCSCGGTDCKGQEENAALQKLIINAGYIITNFNGEMALCRDPWHQPKEVQP